MMDEEDPEMERIQRMCTEIRAHELREVLKLAVLGKPQWRSKAKQLLHLIDVGALPDGE